MRGGLRRWKRGSESRGIRNAIAYAVDGTCDAHLRPSVGVDASAAYSAASASTVTRFTAVQGSVARDALDVVALRRWIAGQNPANGDPRGRELTSENADLLMDGTINFPKSHSVAALIDEELAAEFESLQDRLREHIIVMWQRELNARRGAGGRIREDIARLEVVELQHRRSRALDPHIHRHLWLSMKVQGVDGQWSSLDSRVAMKMQTLINAEGELASCSDPEWMAVLAAHGFTLDDDGEIAQLKQAVRPLSRRSSQIEANREELTAIWRAAHPGRAPGPEELHHIDELAWAKDRPDKPRDLDEREWESRIRSELAAIDPGLVAPRLAASLAAAPIASVDRDLLAAMAVVNADDRSVSSNARFSVWDVRAGAVRAIARSGIVADRRLLDELIEDVTARGLAHTIDLVPDDVDKPPHIKSLMAESTVRVKLRVGNRLMALSDPGPLPRTQTIRLVAKKVLDAGVSLDAGQADAARAIAGRGRLVAVIGPAGTGKTTLLRVADAALEMQRRRMLVVAPTKKAAAVAEREIGTPAVSLHALLFDYGWRWSADDAGAQSWMQLAIGDTDPTTERTYLGPERFTLRRGDRIVVDEAGMVDLYTADALAIVAQQTGAGIAMIGDPLQAAPVGHRGAMAALIQAADDLVELTDLHRFADPEFGALTLRLRNVTSDPEAADVASSLDDAGHIIRVGSEDAARSAMVDAWFESAARHERIALVSGTNDDAQAINTAIQQRRVDRGELDERSVAFGQDEQRILIGDVIQTRRNDANADVQNRATWVVKAIRSERIELANIADTTDRRFVSVDYAADHLHLAYASTVHGIQGETTDAAIVGPNVDAAGLYVGLTRGRTRNQAIVIAHTHSASRQAIARSMLRGTLETTIEQSRRGVESELRRAAREPALDPAAPIALPTSGSSRGIG